LAIAKLALFIAVVGGIWRVRNLSRLAAMARLWHDRSQPWSQTVDAEARSGKVVFRFSCKIARASKDSRAATELCCCHLK